MMMKKTMKPLLGAVGVTVLSFGAMLGITAPAFADGGHGVHISIHCPIGNTSLSVATVGGTLTFSDSFNGSFNTNSTCTATVAPPA
jgi:hypothetical protein